MSETNNTALLALTAQIVSAHLSKNPIPVEDLPGLIRQTYQALGSVAGVAAPTEGERPTPAVPLKKSVFPDYIVCLEDGKKLKMIKRYLQSTYNMTPDQYRERWGLPKDYPMTAPNYSAQRGALARKIGLGRKAAVPEAVEEAAKPSRKRAAKTA